MLTRRYSARLRRVESALRNSGGVPFALSPIMNTQNGISRKIVISQISDMFYIYLAIFVQQDCVN
jgi:hypothetical protein